MTHIPLAINLCQSSSSLGNEITEGLTSLGHASREYQIQRTKPRFLGLRSKRKHRKPTEMQQVFTGDFKLSIGMLTFTQKLGENLWHWPIGFASPN